jgi:hypothetical protein
MKYFIPIVITIFLGCNNTFNGKMYQLSKKYPKNWDLTLQFTNDTTFIIYHQNQSMQLFNFRQIDENILFVNNDSIINKSDVNFNISDSIIVFKNHIMIRNHNDWVTFKKRKLNF